MILTVVVPVYNEIETLQALVAELRSVLDPLKIEYELLIVDDGSTDGSRELVFGFAERDARIQLLSFSRNFGHQAAVSAGLDFAEGDAVVVMDGDLQDPPSLLPDMLALFDQGYDVVSPQRISRRGDSFFKRTAITIFYWLMQKLVDKRVVPEVGDFRLYSRSAVLAIRNFREQHRFMRGLVAWLGLKEAIVPLHRQPRYAGEGKYPFWKLFKFAWTAVSSFSALPLRMSLGCGILLCVLSIVYFLYAAYNAVASRHVVPGWTSLVFLQCLFSGFTLLAIGLIGDYLAKVYEEAKGRPLYIVNSRKNVNIEGRQIQRAMVLPVRPDKAKAAGDHGA